MVGFQAHMNETHGGFKVDASVRYFTEDIPYGLLLIKAFAEGLNLSLNSTCSFSSIIRIIF